MDEDCAAVTTASRCQRLHADETSEETGRRTVLVLDGINIQSFTWGRVLVVLPYPGVT